MSTFQAGMTSIGIDIEPYYLGKIYDPRLLSHATEALQEKAVGFDIVHAQFGSVCGYVVSRLKDKKTILSLRGSDWHRYSTAVNYHFWHALIATYLTKRSIPHYDAILTMSRRMQNQVEVRYPFKTVHFLPDPIDTSLFYPRAKEACRKELGYQENKNFWVLFTTLSTKNPIKRLRLAQDAVQLASQNIPNLELRIATGLRHDEMPTFVNACDVTLCTSTHEGWPNSVKEGLACNKPFVSTNVSDLYNIAEHEESCFVCEPSAKKLAAALEKVYHTKTSYDLTKHVSEMDLQVMSRGLSNIYESVITGRQG
jgi:glycosyltransferase involved in cell wall biosynthesis